MKEALANDRVSMDSGYGSTDDAVIYFLPTPTDGGSKVESDVEEGGEEEDEDDDEDEEKSEYGDDIDDEERMVKLMRSRNKAYKLLGRKQPESSFHRMIYPSHYPLLLY